MKKLIVAAVAAAVAIPVAAMADATMYGKIHATVGMYDSGANAANDNDLTVADNSSRIGVKGSEDLGGGLKAVYDFQFGMDVDDNSESAGTALSGRHSYVGVGGGFGTVLLGRLSSPRKSVGMKTNFFTDRMGDLRGLQANRDEGYLQNVLAYASPKMGGLSVTAAYTTSAPGVTADDADNSAWSANAIYSNGGIMVGLGHTDYLDLLGANTDNSDTTIGASMKMGGAKIAGSYTMSDHNGTDMNFFNIGASFSMGANTLLAQVNQTDFDGTDTNATQFTVGVDHKMSKRTTVYAQYSTIDGDAGTSWDIERISDGSTGASQDPSGFAVGLIHKF